MTKSHVGSVVALLLVATLLFPQAAASQEPTRRFVDGIAAVVGNEIILESDVDEELYLFNMRTGGETLSEANLLEFRSGIVNEMVDEMLLVAMARRDSIILSARRLDEEMARRVDELEERHGSQEALDEALAAQGMTLSDLTAIYRDDIERRLLAEMVVRQEVHGRIDVTWREVEDYYEEHATELGQMPESYRFSGIMVTAKISEKAKHAAIERMTEARDRIDAGEAFADIALEYSDDASAASGGDLGWFDRGTMVPEFEEAAFALEPGEVSGIVPSRFGFHIIRMIERDGDRVHASHILLKVMPGPDDETRAVARAESLRQMVLDGADFSSVAAGYSEDIASSARGGDLGWFSPGDLDPAFVAPVAALSDGEMTGVLKGASDYYVLQLTGHEEEREAELDEIREQLKDYIFNLRAEEAYVALMDRLKSEIYIDIRTEMVSP
ncbi:peptidylprolyl isomerase [bacterium]|nr:peptidylprolyl isomerase [bacterium]